MNFSTLCSLSVNECEAYNSLCQTGKYSSTVHNERTKALESLIRKGAGIVRTIENKYLMVFTLIPLNMTTSEIKQAVDNGQKVYWKSLLYPVIKDTKGQYLINCTNGSAIGLTWTDGETLNGKPEDFFVTK